MKGAPPRALNSSITMGRINFLELMVIFIMRIMAINTGHTKIQPMLIFFSRKLVWATLIGFKKKVNMVILFVLFSSYNN